MAAMMNDQTFQIEPSQGGQRLDAALRSRLSQASWATVRKLITTGKVALNDSIRLDPGERVSGGEIVTIRMNAARPSQGTRLTSDDILHVDAHLVVVRKPAGISSVPFEPGERGTLHDLVRAWLNRTSEGRKDRFTGELGIVHRLDKETSGVLVFTRTLAAKRHIGQQLRLHTVERAYLAIAHGKVIGETIRSNLVADRGDGIRGSTPRSGTGQTAVTHVEPLEALQAATLVRCRLETGRTHQIRIHLSERGHPLVGERVYIRNFNGPCISAPRIMLHATVLGVVHPATEQLVRFEEPMPLDMRVVLTRLRSKDPP